jgi:hypothetical protein
MSKTIFSLAVGGLLLALGFPTEAQQAKKVPRIGYLSSTSPSAGASRIEAFRQGLRDLGYIEGDNLVIEWRYAQGKLDRIPLTLPKILIKTIPLWTRSVGFWRGSASTIWLHATSHHT